MRVDENLLYEFESGLNPQDLKNSPTPATIIGYGEISAIFQIADNSEVAFKRLPLFSDRPSAELYIQHHDEYCHLLTEAGLRLPEHEMVIIEPIDRPVAVYIAQKLLPSRRFGHQLIHEFDGDNIRLLLEIIVAEISRIWRYNRSHQPAIRLALDGQLSNWVWFDDPPRSVIYYIDTSTPLFRKEGIEQLDPELFLKSAPAFLRWILRWLFLKDVIDRYYDQRRVYTDLAANLYKEQRPDLIPEAVTIINRQLGSDQKPLTVDDVEKYYREDKLIWSFYLSFRRIDRWLTTKIFRRRYEYILPGRIRR
ncbi:MAG: hypothetical protein IMF02_06095 [Proteobacteria bacterium]|nr:hypothetical protein [Pseudomonadota bacterium]